MKKLGVVMDPIETIGISHDSSFALMLAAQSVHWEIYYIKPADLYVINNEAYAIVSRIQVQDDPHNWYQLTEPKNINLNELDIIFMRKDPPFNQAYLYMTYILELAEKQGVKIINAPAGLRDANEKMFITWFPQCIAPTMVCANQAELRAFIEQYREVILKPLDGMGGASIYYVTPQEKNLSVILENMTQKNQKLVMAQLYLPAIAQGDKRIILIDGLPAEYALARTAAAGELRANLAAGGSGRCVTLTPRDRWLCEQIAPTLRQKGLFIVGLDVIGDYITEINITSPTCMREIAHETGLNIAMSIIEKLS